MKYSLIFLSAVMAGVVPALPVARGTAPIDIQGWYVVFRLSDSRVVIVCPAVFSM